MRALPPTRTRQKPRRRTAAALSVTISAALLIAVASGSNASAAPKSEKAQPKTVPALSATEQAIAKARRTGETVSLPASTTSTSTLTANPDGTFTANQSVQPVRKFVDGTWHDLDATLHANPDGTISPAITTADLTLSGDGTGPLAELNVAGRTLTVGSPLPLPRTRPDLDGPTATYRNVADGIDLTVTADEQGGFSQVLVVHNAKAAANPALKRIAQPLKADNGLTASADKAGNLSVEDVHGQPYFTASAAMMWDSSTASAKVTKTTKSTSAATGTAKAATSGAPALASSDEAPGPSAKVESLDARISGKNLVLTPDPELLSGPDTVYPVYIDPTWNPNPAGSKRNSWTYVNSRFSSQSYWKTSDLLQVGYNGWEEPYFKTRTFFNVSVPKAIYGAEIIESSMKINEQWAPSCSKRVVELWKTGPISSNTDWGNQPDWQDKLDSVNAAFGYPGCVPEAISFDTTSVMRDAANPKNKWTNITLGLRANDEDDKYAWKKFSTKIASFSTTYNHVPAKPTKRSTSPATTCSGTVKTIGDGDVALYAKASDPDKDQVATTFRATLADGTEIAEATIGPRPSGSDVKYIIRRSTFEKYIDKKSPKKVTWRARVSDYRDPGDWSDPCSFTMDRTRPGAPTVEGPDDNVIGTASTFTITAADATTTTYSYQLNGGAPKTVAGPNATITLKFPRYTNVLTVTAISAGGNIGDTSSDTFNATAAATAADGDLTGDGIPDLITPGAVNGLPSGLWLAHGQAGTGHSTGNGRIVASATNLGIKGTGLTTPGTPHDFDGAQVITGRFTGSGLQDTLTYFPTGTYAGKGSILNGNGDGSATTELDSNNQRNLTSTFADANDLDPQQVVNAGDMSQRGLTYPDILTIGGDTQGHYLVYFASTELAPGIANYEWPTTLTTPAPDGTMNWDAWTIATAQTGSGTVMYLWNKSTNALYLWSNPTFDYGTGILTPGPQYLIATNFAPGNTAILQAADIDGDATVDLWATTPGPTTTAYLITGLNATGPATITTQPAQTLITSKHTWPLDDTIEGTFSTAANTTGTLPLTGTTGVTGNDGELFSPDAEFNGTSGSLSTTGPALSTDADFTASAWVNPTTASGTVFSQQGTKTSGMSLFIDPSTKYWNLAMPRTDADSPVVDTAFGYAARIQGWTHITVTYKKSSGNLAIYLDGVERNITKHTTTFRAGGRFRIGSRMVAGAQTNWFKGQIADVQVWNQTLTPSQVAQQASTPGYVLLESDDTNYKSGTTWTTAHGRMTFSGGVLTVYETNNGNAATKFGTAGYPNAVLTVQNDGNIVIYPQAAHTFGTALWASNTYGHPDSSLFFQPDGNLVHYDSDGAVLWLSDTKN